MKSKIFAIVLIVLGVGATLGGVYGQVFLADDDGHHDNRPPTFALQSQVGVDELVVETEGENAVLAEVRRAGQPVGLDTVHDAAGHYFVVDDEFTWYEHLAVLDESETVALSAPAGTVRVVAQVAPEGGPDFLELGVTVDVAGTSLDEKNITDTDEWTNGSITVRRQNFDFVLSAPWNGDDVYDGPALLTLFRAEDFAFAHAHATVVGDNRFSFATDLPGLGDYLAAVEFEQDGELVTAIFRFTL